MGREAGEKVKGRVMGRGERKEENGKRERVEGKESYILLVVCSMN